MQQELGELEAARVTQQRALAINQAVYGPEHPAVANTLGNLGIVQLVNTLIIQQILSEPQGAQAA